MHLPRVVVAQQHHDQVVHDAFLAVVIDLQAVHQIVDAEAIPGPMGDCLGAEEGRLRPWDPEGLGCLHAAGGKVVAVGMGSWVEDRLLGCNH